MSVTFLYCFCLLLMLTPLRTFADTHNTNKMSSKLISKLEDLRKILIPLSEEVVEKTLHNMASFYIPVESDSPLCRTHSAQLLDSFLENEDWALRMVDASSKLPAGLVEGHLMDLGNYDQCLGVEAPQQLFTGQHCFVETRGLMQEEFDDFGSDLELAQPLGLNFAFSLCVPTSCSARDVQVHVNTTLNSVNASAHLRASSCSSNAVLELSVADYFAILVILVVFIAVVASSSYDYLSNVTEKKSLLKSFSVFQNTRQMLAKDLNPDSVSCIHGIRVLALSWIILGHRMTHLLQAPPNRFQDFAQNLSNISWAPMQQVGLSVEIFFLLSGVLVTYNFFKDQEKGKKFNYVEFCFRRYCRLTPSLAFMVLLTSTLAVRFTDGPVWRRSFEHQQTSCQTNWWTTLLYISNYVHNTQMCMVHTWYLSADFQMHVLAPVILLIFKYSRRLRVILIPTLLLATISAAFTHAFLAKTSYMGAFRLNQKDLGYVFNGYTQIQFRASTFLYGTFLGYLVFKIKQEQGIYKLSKYQLWVGWMVSCACIIVSVFSVVVFLDPGHVRSPWMDSTALVLQRNLIALAVAWVIYACVLQCGGKVNNLLSWQGWVPLSRLSYGMYLVHYLVQDVHTLSTRVPVTVSTSDTWYLFFSDFGISCILAAILYLLVEAPFTNMFKQWKML